MARKHSKSSKKRTHRRRQRAGGWGFTGPSSIPGTPGTVSNPQVFTGIGDCRATEPGYTIPTSQYAASMKGLPGMNGGGKRTRRSGKGKTRKHRQRGGRYGFYPEGDVNPSGQAWWAGSYAPIQRIACEGTTQNPLNPTHTGSSAPPGAASGNYFYNPLKGLMSGGSHVGPSHPTTTGQRGGGATQMAPATYGVGNVDSMYYYAPTAGYANTASTWKDSVGAPVQIQVPFAARSMNQACLTTGGHPPLTGALQKGGKRSKKNKTKRGGSLLNTLTSTVSGLFGTTNVTDVSGVNMNQPPQAPPPQAPNTNTSGAGAPALSISIPEAPVPGSPRTPNYGSQTPNNGPQTPSYGPQTPEFGGGRRRNKKQSRKHARKHMKGGVEGAAGAGAAGAGAAAPARGQGQQLPQPQPRLQPQQQQRANQQPQQQQQPRPGSHVAFFGVRR